MSFRQSETPTVAAAKAGFSAATAYRIEDDPRLPPQKKVPRNRRRQDPLIAVWDSEVVPLLKSTPGLRPIAICPSFGINAIGGLGTHACRSRDPA